LSAFTFITPLFGVVASYFIMQDTLTLAFGAAALLVIAGLYPVGICGADFAAHLRKEHEKYGRIIRAANIKAQ